MYTALLTLTPEPQEHLSPEREPRRRSAVEQLNTHTRLVLLGDPGGGKSTFVNFVALCLAGQALDKLEANLALLTSPLPPDEDERRPGDKDEKPQPQPWTHGALLPVRVILRDFAARGLPPPGQRASAEHLWRFIVAELKSNTLDEFAGHLKSELMARGGLLLLDGLDEVPEAEHRRAQLKQAVESFAATFGKCRILVTSRTYAYQKQDWRLQSFAEAVLAPFTPGQIQNFVDRWYAHIALLRGLNRDDAQGRAELLKRAIANSDRLSALAERPLLLTLMASLHAWRGGSLPERREELYADTVDLLLDWWEKPKVVRDAAGRVSVQQPSLAEWLRVDKSKVRALLEELAFDAHASQPPIGSIGGQPGLQGTADVREGDLVSGLMRLSQNPDVNPARLVEYLSQRAGLLLPHGVGVFTFPHRTFQEYLAACYLTDHDYPDKAADLARADLNRWREVALLAGAKASRGSAATLWQLAEALCYREPDESSKAPDVIGAHLAGQALAETANLERVSERDQPKLARVQRWLVHILKTGALPAVERARAGDTLAALGDIRFNPQAWGLPAEPLLGFLEIPAGEFIMGDDADDDSKPQHRLTLPRYFVARYPVTVAQFKAFVDASGHKLRDKDSIRGRPNHPVVNVTWHEAIAYCDWLTETLRQWQGTPEPLAGLLRKEKWCITLPSEAEWEKAARSSDGRAYPWGNDFDPDKANTSETGIGATSAVGSFSGGASSYGLLDLSGNVWEWTRSLWGKDFSKPDFKYPYDPKDKRREDLKAPDDILRVLRGGSFFNGARDARCAFRGRYNPFSWVGFNGFRVAASPFRP